MPGVRIPLSPAPCAVLPPCGVWGPWAGLWVCSHHACRAESKLAACPPACLPAYLDRLEQQNAFWQEVMHRMEKAAGRLQIAEARNPCYRDKMASRLFETGAGQQAWWACDPV
jgi:hypothetical protein